MFTPHRPLRLSDREPRAAAIETSVAALGDTRTRSLVAAHSVEIHPDFTLAFVEFDDQGRFWNRDQLALALRTLETENHRSETAGVIAVVFAHGWRHGCDVCDSNVACFRTFLKQAASDSFVASRISGGRVRPKRVVGIYAGWRGRSTKIQPFEDLSFWARNRVARRIAVGDFVELLTRVELFTRKANAAEPNRARLAVIGHSLGGTMVYTALANILKARAVEAAENQDSPDPRASVIRGFGDLVVLVNPAFEASLYAPLKEIADRFRRFSPLQTPVMVTIESETDMANRFWFPLGRNVETAFQHTGPQSPRAEIVSAVGHYAPFWTHRLTAAAPARRRSLPDFFPASPSCSCDLAMEPIGDAEAAELVALLAGHGSQAPVLGQEPTPFGRGRLALVNPIDPKNPFWVVRASDDVLPGHSGIFTSYLIDFIRRVILEANAHADASR